MKLSIRDTANLVIEAVLRTAGAEAVAGLANGLLEQLAPEHIQFAVENQISLWDELPDDFKEQIRQAAIPYQAVIKRFPDEAIGNVLAQVRPDLASVIMADSQGMTWFLALITEVKGDLLRETDGSNRAADI